MDESLIEQTKLTVDMVISKLLREDIFLPFMPELLSYDIIFTTSLPHPAAIWEEGEKIFINPTSPMYTQFTPDEIMAFVLIHEDMHVLLKHTARVGHRDKTIWNFAGDLVINALVFCLAVEAGENSILKNIVTDKRYKNDFLYDEQFENMIEEEVYDKLFKKKMVTKKKYSVALSEFMKGMEGEGDGEGDPQPGDGEGSGTGKPDKDGKKSGKGSGKEKPGEEEPDEDGGTGGDGEEEPQVEITEVELDMGGGKKFNHTDVNFPDIEYESEAVKKEADEKRQQRVSMSRQLLESSLRKGIGSAELKSFLQRLFKVQIDWGKILADSILTAMEKSSDLTWGKPRTSWMANPSLPYLPSIDEEERYGTVIFSVDESGSMSDDDVRKAASIVNDSKDHFKDIIVIKHDYSISWEKKYTSDELDVEAVLTRRTFGGTSHKDVFERVNEIIRSDPDAMISCFIAVTDMESDIEETQKLMPLDIPRIYIVNHNHGKYKNVSGRIIRIK